MHTVVARSTFPSQKCAKHTSFGPLLEVEMLKKCTLLWREAHFQVKMLKAPHVQTTFGRSDVVSRGRRKGFCALSKVGKKKNVRLLNSFKSVAWDIRRGSAKMNFPWQARYKRHVRRSGRPPGAHFLRMHFGASDLQFWEDDFV